MAESPSSGAWRHVRIPVIVTIAVVLARLGGELAGLGSPWVTDQRGPSFVILSALWLAPLFGLWFAWRLVGAGRGPNRPGVAAILNLFAAVVIFAGRALVDHVVQPGYPLILAVFAGISVIALVFSWRAWPALLGVSFRYALLVRVAVMVLTVIAVLAGWGTHLEATPAWLHELTKGQRLAVLCGAQIVFWVPATVLLTALFGSLIALMRGVERND